MSSALKPVALLGFFCVLLVTADRGHAQGPVIFEQLWKLETGSVIYGGIQSDGLRLYAGSEDGVMRAIDPDSGEIAWEFEAGAAIASSSAVDDMRVYFHTRAGKVHALNKADGEPEWTFTTGGERQWDYWDYYLSTPAVDDRQLYFGSGDHHIYAVNKRTGQLRWKVATGNIVHGEPVISGEKVLAGGFDGRMYAIDRGSGRVLWTFKTVGNAYFRNGELPGAAVASDGLVYFGGRDYNIYALLEETGTGAWNQVTPSWIVGQPLVVGEDLVVVNSDGATVLSYNRKTGEKNWEFANSYNMFAGAEQLGAEHLLVASLDGRITALSREDGSPAGYYETAGSRARRSDFFKDDGSIDFSGLRSVEDLMDLYDRQLEAMGGMTGSLVVAGDRVFYAAANGEIAALRIKGIAVPEQGQE
jgi:outer membrane protein assembly factor BamB